MLAKEQTADRQAADKQTVMEIEFCLNLPRDDVAIGVVIADGVTTEPASAALQEAIQGCVEQRKSDLDPALDARRQACREMLRNGRYKPTGRGKPANEYLLRAAAQGTFPSINALVDSNNVTSLRHMVPISLWDIDLAATQRFAFRLGRAGESYVFNHGGQVLEVEDLICGCAVTDDAPDGEPIVNAIKDCLKTKTVSTTTRIAAAVYCPLSAMSEAVIADVTSELATWVSKCGDDPRVAHGVLTPGTTMRLGC